MKKFLFLLVLFSFSSFLHAQQELSSLQKDSVNLELVNGDSILYSAIIDKLINQQFTNIVTGQLRTSMTSFASVSTADDKLALGINTISSKGNVWVFELSAGIKSGLASLIKDTYAASKIGLGVQFNYLAPGISNFAETFVTYNRDALFKYAIDRNKIVTSYVLDSLNLSVKYNPYLFNAQWLKEVDNLNNETGLLDKQISEAKSEISEKTDLIKERKKKRDEINALIYNETDTPKKEKLKEEVYKIVSEITVLEEHIKENALKIDAAENEKKKLKPQIDSLTKEIGKSDTSETRKYRNERDSLKLLSNDLEAKIKSETNTDEKKKMTYQKAKLDARINVLQVNLETYTNKGDALMNLNTNRKTALAKIDSEFKIRGQGLFWVSAGLTGEYNVFKLFLPAQSLDSQVQNKKSYNFGGKLQCSYYSWSDYENTTYLSANVNFSLSDNFSSLKKKELNEVTNYGLNPGDRTITNKTDVYTGNFEQKLVGGVNTLAEGYHFILQNSAALHWLFEFSIKESERRIFGLGGGVLLSYKNDKEEAKVNSELYVKFYDLDNTNKSDFGFWERYDVGVRVSFPIKFK